MGKTSRGAGVFTNLETLEDRRLMAWGAYADLIDQDVAAAKYASVNGNGLVIADIDTGISFGHPALAGKIWKNPGEVPNNGKDDDGNGWKDDVNGWDFVTNDNNPSDDQGHGTMTAGLMVAGKFNNWGNNRGYKGDGKDYQGVAAGAQVIPLKVIDGSLRLDVSRVEKALQWVVANYKRYGIDAVNMSLSVGYDGYGRIQDELKTLWTNGVFIGASSGNSGSTNNTFAWPAASPYAMSVGALGSGDSVASITCRGSALDIVAPGATPYLSRSGDYNLGTPATSIATPIVTAAGALLKQVNPGLSSDQIVKILRDSGASVYDPTSKLSYRRLDLDNAIAMAQKGGASSPVQPVQTQTRSADSRSKTVRLEAEKTSSRKGIWSSGAAIGSLDGGDLAEYRGVDLGAGVSKVAVRLAAPAGSARKKIQFRLDSPSGKVIGTLSVKSTGGWGRFATQSVGLAKAAGVHNVYLTFAGKAVANVDWLELS